MDRHLDLSNPSELNVTPWAWRDQLPLPSTSYVPLTIWYLTDLWSGPNRYPIPACYPTFFWYSTPPDSVIGYHVTWNIGYYLTFWVYPTWLDFVFNTWPEPDVEKPTLGPCLWFLKQTESESPVLSRQSDLMCELFFVTSFITYQTHCLGP